MPKAVVGKAQRSTVTISTIGRNTQYFRLSLELAIIQKNCATLSGANIANNYYIKNKKLPFVLALQEAAKAPLHSEFVSEGKGSADTVSAQVLQPESVVPPQGGVGIETPAEAPADARR